MPRIRRATPFPSSASCGSPRSARSRSHRSPRPSQEIAAYYKANQATYGGKDLRVLSQAVVPDRRSADAIVARARGGASFVAATAPAGLAPPTSRSARKPASNSPRWPAPRSPRRPSRPLRERSSGRSSRISAGTSSRWNRQRNEAGNAARRSARRDRGQADRRQAQECADRPGRQGRGRNRRRDELRRGRRARNKLAVVETPPLTAGGVSRSDPAYKLPANSGTVAQGRVSKRAPTTIRRSRPCPASPITPCSPWAA